MAKEYFAAPSGEGGDPAGAVSSHFVYQRRRRDAGWLAAFALFWAACLAAGAYGVVHRNGAFLTTDWTDPQACPARPEGRGLLEGGRDPGSFNLRVFFHATAGWLAASVLAALLLGLAFLKLFQHHPHSMTRATIAAQVAVPAVAGLAYLAGGLAAPAVFMLLLAALAALVFSWWRNEIALASRLLGVSAHGLAANPQIIGVTLALNLGGLAAITPLLVLAGFAWMNGEVIPNPERQGGAQCVDPSGADVLCCSWQPDAFAQAYLPLVGLTMLWTMAPANQFRVFVVSGTVAQWYFAPAGAAPARGGMRRSLGYALGPQLGSLCFSSAVLTVADVLRQAAEQAQQQNQDRNILMVCLAVVAQCFWALIEYLTKFATVYMAITGDAFLAAGRSVTDLLARNFLNAFASTAWFAPMVVQLAAFVLAASWGLLTGWAYYLTHRGMPAAAEAAPGVNAAILGAAAGGLALFVLGFLGGVLLSVLDATFVCWAIDRDSQTVSNVAVYEVFQTVPLPGIAVESPDGELRYGAPQSPGDAGYQPPSVVQQPGRV